jgi:hypothetical protein
MVPGFCIPASALRLADIIVATSNHPQSELVRAATGGTVSHALLVIGTGSVVEAVGTGTREVPLRVALAEASFALALRHKRMTDTQADSVTEFARLFAAPSRPYDVIGAVGAGLTSTTVVVGCLISPVGCIAGQRAVNRNASPAQRDLRFFCSELVARAFQLAGVPLVDEDPSFVNPREILESKHLDYVGHLIGG